VQLVVNFQDRALSDYAKRLEQFGQTGPVVLAQALNQEGHAARKATVAAETAQTGLSDSTIGRAQQTIDATPGRLAFWIVSRGGNVRLKFFHPSEGDGGVSATPWNRQTFYPGAFMKSGPKGHRKLSGRLGGQVFENIQGGKWGGKIRVKRSGLFIPHEMVTGATAGAFNAAVAVMAPRIVTRLGSLLP
jgi:hypothetical protein